MKIAFLGLGAMGVRMAANLSEAHPGMVVWNRSPGPARAFADEHPVAVASSPREAAADADVVIAMVSDDLASESVWLDPDTGALAAMHGDAVAIESSTISPGWTRRLAAVIAEAGPWFVEGPVVGSRPQAEAGALLTLAGGTRDAVDRAWSVLDVNSAAVRHVGPAGAGAELKLAVNGLFGIQVAAYAEMAGLLDRSAVDLDTALDVVAALPITSPGLQRIVGLIRERAFDPNFPVNLVDKDFGYLTQLADSLDADTPLTRAAAAVYSAGAAGPERDLDIAGIAQRYVARYP